MEPTSFALDIYPAMAAALKNFSSTPLDLAHLQSAYLPAGLLHRLHHPGQRQPDPGTAVQDRAHAPRHRAGGASPLYRDMESDLRMQRYDLIIDMTQSGRSMLKSEVLYAEQVKVVCASSHPRLGSSLTTEAYFTEEHVALAQWQVRGSMLTAEHLPQMA